MYVLNKQYQYFLLYICISEIICIPICISICLSIYLSVCLSDCLSVRPSVRPSVHLSICPSIHLPTIYSIIYLSTLYPLHLLHLLYLLHLLFLLYLLYLLYLSYLRYLLYLSMHVAHVYMYTHIYNHVQVYTNISSDIPSFKNSNNILLICNCFYLGISSHRWMPLVSLDGVPQWASSLGSPAPVSVGSPATPPETPRCPRRTSNFIRQIRNSWKMRTNGSLICPCLSWVCMHIYTYKTYTYIYIYIYRHTYMYGHWLRKLEAPQLKMQRTVRFRDSYMKSGPQWEGMGWGEMVSVDGGRCQAFWTVETRSCSVFLKEKGLIMLDSVWYVYLTIHLNQVQTMNLLLPGAKGSISSYFSLVIGLESGWSSGFETQIILRPKTIDGTSKMDLIE